MSTHDDIADREPAKGIPGPLDFDRAASGANNLVFVCRKCNTRISGSARARQHPCTAQRPCPRCDSHRGRPTRGVHGSVVECQSCGHAYRPRGEDAD
jgi:hypothetical protein